MESFVMKRLLALSIICAACDPILSIDATVNVPVDVQAALTFPQEVVVDLGPLGVRRAFILCEASAQPVTIAIRDSSIGCAEASTVRAWVTPFTPADGEEIICGEQPAFTGTTSVDPLATDPSDEQVVFSVLEDDVLVGCASASEAVELTVSF